MRLLAARELVGLLERRLEFLIDPLAPDPPPKKIRPQQFAEWRRILREAADVAQLSRKAAIGIILQSRDRLRDRVEVAAAAVLVVRMRPAAIVEKHPERVVIERG